jgi:hypothetical protein
MKAKFTLLVILMAISSELFGYEWMINGIEKVDKIKKYYYDCLLFENDKNEIIYCTHELHFSGILEINYKNEISEVLDYDYNPIISGMVMIGIKNNKLVYLAKSLYSNEINLIIDDLLSIDGEKTQYSFSKYGKYLISKNEKSIKIRKSENFEIAKEFKIEDEEFPYCLDFSDNDDFMATFTTGSKIQVFNFKDSIYLKETVNYEYEKFDKIRFQIQEDDSVNIFACYSKSLQQLRILYNNESSMLFSDLTEPDDFDIDCFSTLLIKTDSILRFYNTNKYHFKHTQSYKGNKSKKYISLKKFQNHFNVYLIENGLINLIDLDWGFNYISNTNNKFTKVIYNKQTDQLIASAKNSIIEIDKNTGTRISTLVKGENDLLSPYIAKIYIRKYYPEYEITVISNYKLINPLTNTFYFDYFLSYKNRFEIFEKINDKIYSVLDSKLYRFDADSIRIIDTKNFRIITIYPNSNYAFATIKDSMNNDDIPCLYNVIDKSVIYFDYNFTSPPNGFSDSINCIFAYGKYLVKFNLLTQRSENIFIINNLPKIDGTYQIKYFDFEHNIAFIFKYDSLSHLYSTIVYDFQRDKYFEIKHIENLFNMEYEPFNDFKNNQQYVYNGQNLIILCTPKFISKKHPYFSETDLVYQNSNGHIVSYKLPESFVSVEENPILSTNSDFEIYPNPAESYIEIFDSQIQRNEFEKENQLLIQIINYYGEIVIKSYINTNDNGVMKIDISMIPNGVYMVKIRNKLKKFIKI